MLIDTGLGADPTKAADRAKQAEADGFDAIFTAETSRDPFFPLVLAAPATERITLGTSIAVAFARNPMTLANIGNDLNYLSHGRFILGLGSQIKPHITKRFSMPWGSPAARMREMVLAMHAIWGCWNDRTKLEFRGEFYQHTLMTPFFDPGPNEFGPPRVFIAAVGPLMTQVAGEVCDGMFAHSFTTPEFLNDVTLPALAKGRERSGRTADDFEIQLPAFVVTGPDDETTAAVAQNVRRQISFYGSTPAYRAVLEHHGWGDLQGELNALSKKGEWETMAGLIDDDVLDAFAVVAEPNQVARKLTDRYGSIVQRLSINTMTDLGTEFWAPIVADLR
ncbi:MAG: LLM class F420-dependent oxidoreductase [Actinobacteria bacterium]|nr:LLM class F420-dependent oxidoreductase [Actinomycetota bacterium]